MILISLAALQFGICCPWISEVLILFSLWQIANHTYTNSTCIDINTHKYIHNNNYVI